MVEVAGFPLSQLPPQAQLELQDEERARNRLQEARRHLAARMAAAGLGAAARAWRAGRRRRGKRKAPPQEGGAEALAKRPRVEREAWVRERGRAAVRARGKRGREDREAREEVAEMMEIEGWDPTVGEAEWEERPARERKRARSPDTSRGAYLSRVMEGAGLGLPLEAGGEPRWIPPTERGGWGGQGDG